MSGLFASRECYLEELKGDVVVAAHSAAGLQQDSWFNTAEIKTPLDQLYTTFKGPLPPKRSLHDKNSVLVKADKGETLVILQKDEYDRKMFSFLQNANAKPPQYQLTEHNKKVRSILDKPSLVFGSKGDSLKVMCVDVPRLYGQIKVHKPDQSMRPVVAFYTAPTVLLAKFLSIWFRDVSGFNPQWSTKNSVELAQQLKTKTFPLHSVFFSLDAKNMFTRIPVTHTINIMVKLLQTKGIYEDIIKEFETLLHLCLKDNTYMFFPWEDIPVPRWAPNGRPLVISGGEGLHERHGRADSTRHL